MTEYAANSVAEGKLSAHRLFLIAARIGDYPAREATEQILGLLQEENTADGCDGVSPHWRDILPHLTPDAFTDLCPDYIDIFDKNGHTNPLYETQYGRNRILAKGTDLADIAGFYKAFNLKYGPASVGREMHDHIAVELEFYAHLLLRECYCDLATDSEGVSIIRDARRKFMTAHLGRFAGAICTRPGVESHAFYAPVFCWIAALIEKECAVLQVHPEKLEWIAADKNAGDAIACAVK